MKIKIDKIVAIRIRIYIS